EEVHRLGADEGPVIRAEAPLRPDPGRGQEAEPQDARPDPYLVQPGRLHRTSSPRPCPPRASTFPPAASITCLTIARPRPLPRVVRARSERKKRSKSRGPSSAGTPAPSSATSSTIRSLSRSSETVQVAPSPAYRRAFSSRFSAT